LPLCVRNGLRSTETNMNVVEMYLGCTRLRSSLTSTSRSMHVRMRHQFINRSRNTETTLEQVVAPTSAFKCLNTCADIVGNGRR
jgi:hypothetical protein